MEGFTRMIVQDLGTAGVEPSQRQQHEVLSRVVLHAAALRSAPRFLGLEMQ